MKTFTLALIISCTFASLGQWAFAAKDGGTSSGGADALVHPDGKVQIADPYSTDLRSTIIELGLKAQTYDEITSPEVRLEMARIEKLLTAFGEKAGYNDRKNPFVSRQISHTKNKYYFADQIPVLPECQEKLTYDRLPSGATIEQVACTVGRDTLIVKRLFDGLVDREKALLLSHEGMRRLPKQLHAWIPHVSNGLGAALQIQDSQATLADEELSNALLNGRQVALLTRLYEGVMSTGLSDEAGAPKNYDGDFPSEITPRGGALVSKKSKISPSAYLGVGFFLPANSVVEANVIIANSTLYIKRDLNVSKNVRVRGSEFYVSCGWSGWHSESTPCRSILGEGLMIRNSHVRSLWAEEADTRITDSQIKGHLIAEKGAVVEEARLESKGGVLTLETNARLSRVNDANFTQDVALFSGFFEGIFTGRAGYSSFVIKAGVEIDLKNEGVCPSGRNHFFSKEMWADLRSQADLLRTCAK